MSHKLSFERRQQAISINRHGTVNCCRAVIEGMRARSYGRVVNIRSIIGQTRYAAAKTGIITGTQFSVKGGIYL